MTPFDNPQEAPANDVESTAVDLSPEAFSDIQQVAEILSRYWAAEKDEAKLFSTLTGKAETFYDAAVRQGFFQMARLAYAHYYGLGSGGIGSNSFETQTMQFVGEDGELLQFRLNEFRSFLDQIINMTVKNRPAFQAQAINADPGTLGQINASDSIVKYFYEQVYGERKEKEVVKAEALYGKSFTHLDWDPDGGDDIELEEQVETEMGPMPQTQRVKSGQFLISRVYWWNCPHEVTRSEYDGHLWRMIVSCRSKWEMIARFPIHAKRIEEAQAGFSDYWKHFPGYDADLDRSDDEIVVMVFYHARSAALPAGRKVVYAGDVMVDDGDLPIDEIPIVDYMSCEKDGSSFGISDLWNLIPAEQMKSQILSDTATNIEAFGRPPLVVDEGTDFDLDALANGQKVLTKAPNTEMPQVIQFPAVPPASIQLVELMRKFQQSLSGLNAISRGEADASVKSGTHAALYHAMAVEAQMPRQAQLDLHRERVTNLILQFLKRYAQHPQLVAIAGEDERPYLKTFSRDDIAKVHRVVIKTAAPMMRTQAGRLQIAEMLRDWPGNPIKDPSEVIELLVSGQFKPMYNPTRVQQLRWKQENALLSAAPPVQEVPTGEIDPLTGMPAVDPTTGQPKTKKTVPTVPVFATDNAAQHIIGHLQVLTSPDTLSNPQKMDAVFAHIMEHVEVARTGDPYLAALLGNPPPPMDPLGPGAEMDATASGAEGPSDKDMQRVNDNAQPPSAKSGATDDDDSLGSRLPKPADPPAQAA